MRSTLMSASAPARTTSGGTGAPPQPKRVSDDTSRPERSAAAMRSVRNVVAANVYEHRSRSMSSTARSAFHASCSTSFRPK